ncbi:MAG: Fe-S cluster assembly protein SufB [Bacilli bacterium]|nr:Fe-S cluster assembly protein SufB [Bacilli bacterium]
MEIKGLNLNNIRKISEIKNEDNWVKEYREKSFEYFTKMPLPHFGPSADVDFEKIIYYKTSEEDRIQNSWDNINTNVKNELDSLGVIESEKHLMGIGVQYESEVIYHNMINELKSKNIIFTSIEDALKNYPEISRKYFGKIVPNTDNKYTALNSSVFSGGSFIYIPPNTKLDRPLQSYFRIASKNMGQFERTLIIVDNNSELHYIEGCTAPSYSESSLHAAVVEIFVGENSKCRYTTIQNWAHNVNNLVTKRALVEKNGTMEWIDGNIGSKVTMKYPCCILKGDDSTGTCITISVATANQEQDTGSKMIHLGKRTKSNILSKSIASNGGNATYRGIVDIKKSAINSESIVKCDTLILDDISKSDTIPTNKVFNDSSNIEHEASVSKISEDNLFYLMSRGIDKERATELILLGFLEKFREELPMEYAVELNQLLKRNL